MQNKINKNGSIMIMAAVFISVMLMLSGVSFYILQRATAKEQWGSVWNLIALAGVQEYFNIDCDNTENPSSAAGDCHNKKFTASILRMKEIADANSNMVSNLTVFQSGNPQPEGNYLKVTPGKYFYKQVSLTDDCNNQPYPCFIPLSSADIDSGNLANSFEIEGKVVHGRLTRFIFTNFTGGKQNIDLVIKRRVAAVPLAIAIAVDLSLSVQDSNHIYNSDPAPGDIKNSFFAFEYNTNAGPMNNENKIVPLAAEEVWNNMDAVRNTIETPWNRHFQDDYVATTQYGDSDYSSYINKDFHPAPTDTTYNETHYLINAHRSTADSGYHGPEPFLSIIKGANEAIKLVEKRGVPGDSITFVAFYDNIQWKNVIKRSTDFSYLKEVLDPEKFTSGQFHPTTPNTPLLISPNMVNSVPVPLGKNDTNVPYWIRLGIFPSPGKWTDTIQGLSSSIEQLTTGLGDIPTVKGILLFTDGVINCSPSIQANPENDPETGEAYKRCRNQYQYYKEGMNDLKIVVNDSLARNGVALHTFLVGSAAHYLAIPKENGQCYTDAESRAANIDFVTPVSYANDSEAEAAFVNKDVDPFYLAAYDSYILTKMTGGRWGALLPAEESCESDEPEELDCSGNPNPESNQPKTKVLFDPKCRTIEKQVVDYIEDVIVNSKTFAVVD